jgi:hypothetical protein
MDFGSWFNKANPSRAQAQFAGASIVPFEEQLDCYLGLNPRLRFHVETKSPAEYGGRMEPAVVDLLRRKNLLAGGDAETSNIVIQSFDLASLQRMKQLAPSLPTAFLTPGSTSVPDLTALRPFVDALAPNAAVLQAAPAVVGAAHALGMAVHAWTVDDGPTMQDLLDMGVDGIFTDRPNVLRGLVEAAGTGIPAAARRNPRSFQHGCPGVAGSVSGPLTPGRQVPAFPPRREQPGRPLGRRQVMARGHWPPDGAQPVEQALHHITVGAQGDVLHCIEDEVECPLQPTWSL